MSTAAFHAGRRAASQSARPSHHRRRHGHTVVVARNPDLRSTLPYLLRIPVAGPPLLLKARDVWPRTADYAVEIDGDVVAPVERKSVADLVRRLVDGQLAFAMADLATLPHAAVVVDGRYADALKAEHVQPGFVAELLARGRGAVSQRADHLRRQPQAGGGVDLPFLAAAYADVRGAQRIE